MTQNVTVNWVDGLWRRDGRSEGVPGGSWCMFCDASTHKMPFLVPGDCLPGRRCQAVCLLSSIKVYNKQVQDPVFQQAWDV